MKILFLDESGDHNLSIIDQQYPLFVLGGVIVDKGYAEEEMTEAVQSFKRRLFGRDDLVLHTADITRNRNGFERMKEPAFRARFYYGAERPDAVIALHGRRLCHQKGRASFPLWRCGP